MSTPSIFSLALHFFMFCTVPCTLFILPILHNVLDSSFVSDLQDYLLPSGRPFLLCLLFFGILSFSLIPQGRPSQPRKPQGAIYQVYRKVISHLQSLIAVGNAVRSSVTKSSRPFRHKIFVWRILGISGHYPGSTRGVRSWCRVLSRTLSRRSEGIRFPKSWSPSHRIYRVRDPPPTFDFMSPCYRIRNLPIRPPS